MSEDNKNRLQLVLAPGLLCTADLFRDQIAALSGRADIHIVDTMGMGSVQAMAEKVLWEIDGRFVAIGLSMGGYVALTLAKLAPQRVAGLGLLSTNAEADTEAKKQQRRDLIALSKMGKFKGVTPRLLPRLLSPQGQQDDQLVARVLAMAEAVGQANFTSQQEAIMGRADRRGDLPQLAMPSLVLCGREDSLTPPEQSQEMAGLLPDCELRLLDGVGHLSSMEAPEAVSAALAALLDRAAA